MLSRIHVPIVSDGSGNVTLPGGYGAERHGWLEGVYLKIGTITGGTNVITLTDHETGATLLTLTHPAANAFFLTRVLASDPAGASIAGVAERLPIAAGGIDITVAGAGNSHAGDLYLWIDQGAQS